MARTSQPPARVWESRATVVQRLEGKWVVILERPGAMPMEFTCGCEEQARAFAASLSSHKRPARERVRHHPDRKARSSWFRRLWG